MPVFTKSMDKVDYSDTQSALRVMANHIKYIQEQLEFTLTNLDSSNITEIETDKTSISSGTGGVSMTGDSITLNGKNGESFTVGQDAAGNFVFSVKGRNGEQTIYLSSDGQMVITKAANLSIDCGTW